MLFRFLWIGATRNAVFGAAEEDYLRRLRHFVPCETVVCPERRKSDPRALMAQQTREESDLMKRLRPEGHLVGLTAEGRQFSSEEFAAYVNGVLNSSARELTFLVGGSQGIPQGVLQRADLQLSLGRMTYPHELVRVMLLEQVYRAMTILRGLPYHK